jgi:hypothetical protein
MRKQEEDKRALGLNLEREDKFFSDRDKFRWWALQKLERNPLNGVQEIPKSISPWKICMFGSVQEFNSEGLQSAFKAEKQKLERTWKRQGKDLTSSFEQFHLKNKSRFVAGLVRGFWKEFRDAHFHFGVL